MNHEGERLDREIKKLERELEQPIPAGRRFAVQQALRIIKAKKRAWEKPH